MSPQFSFFLSFLLFVLVLHQHQHRSLRHCFLWGSQNRPTQEPQPNQKHPYPRTELLSSSTDMQAQGSPPVISLWTRSQYTTNTELIKHAFPPSLPPPLFSSFSSPTAKARTRTRLPPRPTPRRQRKPTQPYFGASPPELALPPRSDTATSACSPCLGQ